jgi:hypothetical protein
MELHDARVDSLEIRRGGTVVIAFAHLVGFRALKPELYATYSYLATLELLKCSQLHLAGAVEDGSKVSDGELLDGDAGVELIDLLATKPITSVRLAFDTGSRLVIACQKGRVTLLQRGERLRDWIGPLTG